MGLRLKLSIPVIVVWAIVVLLIQLVWKPSLLETGLQQFEKQNVQQLSILAHSLAEAYLQDDLAHVYATISLVLDSNADWAWLTIHEAGLLVYPLDQPGNPAQDTILLNYHYALSGDRELHFTLSTNPQNFLATLQTDLSYLNLFLVLVIVFGAGSTLIFAERLIRRPVSQLSQAVKQFDDAEEQPDFPRPGKDEIGQLITAFLTMRQHILSYQQDLRIAYDQAMAANQTKNLFLSNMSHELRTPLNTILGFCELMEMEKAISENDHLKSNLLEIRSAGEQLLVLIDGILDFSRHQSKEFSIEKSRFHLKTLIDEVVESHQEFANKNNNQMSVTHHSNFPEIYTDRKKFKQILSQLVSNACKFTNNGTVTIQYEQQENGDITVRITDTGIGMDEKTISGIFAPFHQADNSSSRAYQGAGLGLALAKQMADLIDGEFHVESKPGQGSVFTFFIKIDSPQ